MQSCAASIYANPNPAKGLFCLILIAITGIALFSLAHAMERHGDDAVTVCNQSPLLQMKNMQTGRNAHVCQLPDGRFGVKIVAPDGDTITAFVKEKMRSLDDVVRYLNNRGYY